MPVEVVVSGRTDVKEYFQKSGIREYKKLKHTPLLVFLRGEGIVEVNILDCADELLAYPNDTKVMGQWKGEWRSDFFQFTVRQFRDHIAEYPRELWQIV